MRYLTKKEMGLSKKPAKRKKTYTERAQEELDNKKGLPNTKVIIRKAKAP